MSKFLKEVIRDKRNEKRHIKVYRLDEAGEYDDHIGHPITSGGKYRFYLVTTATPVSILGDVISEVDTQSLALIMLGAGKKAVGTEKWELFPSSRKEEAVRLAKARLNAAKRNEEDTK